MIVCFMYLLDGEYLGVYCVECDVLFEGGMEIFVSDIVEFIYK